MNKKLWYKEIVKTPKRLFVTGVVAFALIASGTGAALALIPSDEPQEVTVKQVAAVEPKEEAPVVEAAPVVETPAPQQVTETVVEPTPVPQPANPYVEGSTFWYVWKRRAEINRPLPTNLGGGSSWDDRAFAAGFTVDKNPEVGAVAVSSRAGAIGIVETINLDGSVVVKYTENTGTTMSAETAAALNYIH